MMDIYAIGWLLMVVCGGFLATAWQSPNDESDLPFSGIENRLFTLLMDGEFDKLFLILKQLLTDTPCEPMIYTYLGQAHTNLKDEIGEEDALMEILNICGNKVLEGYYHYSTHLLGEGRYEDAYDLLSQGTHLFHREAKLHYLYGIALYHLEWGYEALDAFSSAIIRDSRQHEYFFFRAKTNELLEEYDDALRDFTTSIMVCATGVGYAARADLLLYKMDAPYKAFNDYERAMALGNQHCQEDLKHCKAVIGKDYASLFRNWQNLRRDTVIRLGQQVLNHYPSPHIQQRVEHILTQLQQEEYEEQKFWVEYLPQGNEVYAQAKKMFLAQNYVGAFWLLHQQTPFFRKKQHYPFIYYKMYALMDECVDKVME
ncbi:hypothetical protein [uncultured Microscilla sp.]|uniref:hypothetical protein n=1 Tax=uncultured Microscilla sp. TaxID=432653 RepID=UPI0026203F3E|nr:hypothetical protein [uncultured Microscilla sp.]